MFRSVNYTVTFSTHNQTDGTWSWCHWYGSSWLCINPRWLAISNGRRQINNKGVGGQITNKYNRKAFRPGRVRSYNCRCFRISNLLICWKYAGGRVISTCLDCTDGGQGRKVNFLIGERFVLQEHYNLYIISTCLDCFTRIQTHYNCIYQRELHGWHATSIHIN